MLASKKMQAVDWQAQEGATLATGQSPADALRFQCAVPEQVDRITQLQRAAIAAIPGGYYQKPALSAWWRTPAKGLDKLIAAGRYYVVMDGERPLAGAGWEPAGEREAALLRAVFVDPAAAGHGLGAKCVACVEAEAVAAGYKRLLVPAALNAVGFYVRLGYRMVGWGQEEFEPGVVLTYRRLEKMLAQ